MHIGACGSIGNQIEGESERERERERESRIDGAQRGTDGERSREITCQERGSESCARSPTRTMRVRRRRTRRRRRSKMRRSRERTRSRGGA